MGPEYLPPVAFSATLLFVCTQASADGGECISRGVGPYERASLYNKCDTPRVATLSYNFTAGGGATYYCVVGPKKKRLVDIQGVSVLTVIGDAPKDDHSPPDSRICRPPSEQ